MELKEIAETVKRIQGVTPRTKKRQIKFNVAKFTYYTLARKYTRNNLARIGEHAGYDHATVLNGIRKLDGLLKAYPKYQSIYDKCELFVIENSSKKDSPNYKASSGAFFKRMKKTKDLEVKIEKELKKVRSEPFFKTEELKQLNQLDDDIILEFNETRLKPFLAMLKSRKVHNIIEVKGALLLR